MRQWRDQLDALCRQRGLSRAAAIRQALRLWLHQQSPAHGEVFGLWRDRPDARHQHPVRCAAVPLCWAWASPSMIQGLPMTSPQAFPHRSP
ncbi:MAG: ribbon-helix-helix domain-containing protein [Cyanobacteriota bacterium]